MITDNPMFKKMMASGEEQLGRIAKELIGNEKFVQTLQGAVTTAIEAKGLLDRQVANTLAQLHVPTTQDMQKLNERLDELERIFEGLAQKVDDIAQKLEERK